jgi:hypothetical protein
MYDEQAIVSAWETTPARSEIDGGVRWRRWRVFRFQPMRSNLAAEIGGISAEGHRRVPISERLSFPLSLAAKKGDQIVLRLLFEAVQGERGRP